MAGLGLNEHGTEPSGSLKGGECLDQLSDYSLLKDSAVWGQIDIRVVHVLSSK
jgi:hypothetical protein